MNVPARLVAVYAPGCDPIDFHAVAEAYVDGAWRVVDATCLSPRQSMVRIATRRDAADTAFLDNFKGAITLKHMEVTAVVDGRCLTTPSRPRLAALTRHDLADRLISHSARMIAMTARRHHRLSV